MGDCSYHHHHHQLLSTCQPATTSPTTLHHPHHHPHPVATSRPSITDTIITSVSTYHHHNLSFQPPSHHYHNHHDATPPLTAAVLPPRLPACHSARRPVTQHSLASVNHSAPVNVEESRRFESPYNQSPLTHNSALLRTPLGHVRQSARTVPISTYGRGKKHGNLLR